MKRREQYADGPLGGFYRKVICFTCPFIRFTKMQTPEGPVTDLLTAMACKVARYRRARSSRVRDRVSPTTCAQEGTS